MRENIAALGGGPELGTIGGQSAGGAACGALLGVPSARGLFRGALCMSGAALDQTPAGVTEVAERLSVLLGAATLDRSVLEGRSTREILEASDWLLQELGPGQLAPDGDAVADVLGGGMRLPWGPWTDGEVVTEDPFTAARRGGVRVLAGATAHEFNMAWAGADWVTW